MRIIKSVVVLVVLLSSTLFVLKFQNSIEGNKITSTIKSENIGVQPQFSSSYMDRAENLDIPKLNTNKNYNQINTTSSQVNNTTSTDSIVDEVQSDRVVDQWYLDKKLIDFNNDSFDIDTIDGPLNFTLTKFKDVGNGQIIHATVKKHEGNSLGNAIFSIVDDKITATINSGDGVVYEIRESPDGTLMQKVDDSLLGNDCGTGLHDDFELDHAVIEDYAVYDHDAQQQDSTQNENEHAEAASSNDRKPKFLNVAVKKKLSSGKKKVIKILVAYTRGVQQKLGSRSAVLSKINLYIETTNTAFEKSQVNTRLKLVDTMRVSNSNSKDSIAILGSLRKADDGEMDDVIVRGAKKKADLISLVTNLDKYCGRAYMPRPYHSFSTLRKRLFSVVDVDCSDLVFAHEIGHNMGLAHDVENTNSKPYYHYGHGYRFKLKVGHGGSYKGLYRTIMAYDPGTRIDMFSNPEVKINKFTRVGVKNQADSARALNKISHKISQIYEKGYNSSYRIYGRAITNNGVPISDAIVKLSNGSTTRTNKNGYYSFPDLKSLKNYAVYISHREYVFKPSRKTTYLLANQRVYFNGLKRPSISGYVTMGSRKPLANITISLSNGQTTKTNSKGYYVFKNLPAFKYYYVSAINNNYIFNRMRVKTYLSRDKYINFSANAIANLSGRAFTESQAPIANAIVRLNNGWTTKTNSKGYYVFKKLPKFKNYTVTVSKKSYSFKKSKKTVYLNRNKVINFSGDRAIRRRSIWSRFRKRK